MNLRASPPRPPPVPARRAACPRLYLILPSRPLCSNARTNLHVCVARWASMGLWRAPRVGWLLLTQRERLCRCGIIDTPHAPFELIPCNTAAPTRVQPDRAGLLCRGRRHGQQQPRQRKPRGREHAGARAPRQAQQEGQHAQGAQHAAPQAPGPGHGNAGALLGGRRTSWTRTRAWGSSERAMAGRLLQGCLAPRSPRRPRSLAPIPPADASAGVQPERPKIQCQGGWWCVLGGFVWRRACGVEGVGGIATNSTPCLP